MAEKGKTLEAMQETVGGYIECGEDLHNGDCIYVDEEGLLKQLPHFFRIGSGKPYAGNGAVSRINRAGATVSAKTDIEQLERDIIYLTPQEAYSIAVENGW